MCEAFCSILSGGLITIYGVYVPFLFGGAAITTIGTGLLYTLDIGSPSSHWIGYQALAGIGIGLSLQVPIIANQAFVEASEISSVTASTLCEYISILAYGEHVDQQLFQSFKQSAVPSSSQPASRFTPIGCSRGSQS